MQSSPAPHCHHIRTSGVRCGSLALRDKRYCYYHQRSRPLMVRFSRRGRDPVLLSLPLFEDAHAIQGTLHSVVYHFLDGTVDPKTAGLLFYAMQIASSNLKHLKSETPEPGQAVVDLPKLSALPSPEPAEETARMNSHSLRRAHFPYTPTAKDEHYDDVMRQARELKEKPAEVGNELFSTDLPRKISDAINSLDGDWAVHLKREPDDEPEDASDDKLPPGTIKACAERQRAERPYTERERAERERQDGSGRRRL